MYVRADKSCASHVTSLRHSGTISQRRGGLTPGTVHEPRHGTGYPHGVQSSLGMGEGNAGRLNVRSLRSPCRKQEGVPPLICCAIQTRTFGLEILVCSATHTSCSSSETLYKLR